MLYPRIRGKILVNTIDILITMRRRTLIRQNELRLRQRKNLDDNADKRVVCYENKTYFTI